MTTSRFRGASRANSSVALRCPGDLAKSWIMVIAIAVTMIVGSKMPKELTTYRLRQFGLVQLAPLSRRKTRP